MIQLQRFIISLKNVFYVIGKWPDIREQAEIFHSTTAEPAEILEGGKQQQILKNWSCESNCRADAYCGHQFCLV